MMQHPAIQVILKKQPLLRCTQLRAHVCESSCGCAGNTCAVGTDPSNPLKMIRPPKMQLIQIRPLQNSKPHKMLRKPTSASQGPEISALKISGTIRPEVPGAVWPSSQWQRPGWELLAAKVSQQTNHHNFHCRASILQQVVCRPTMADTPPL